MKTTIEFLRILNVKVNNESVNEALLSHPDWPSLLCITDSLQKWNVPNGVGKIERENIDHLPVPFMAYVPGGGEYQLTIVTEVNEDKVVHYRKDYQKAIVEHKQDFIKAWTGVYLIAEPNETSGDPNYLANKRRAQINWLLPFTILIALTVLPFLFFNTDSISSYLQYYILLAGVCVSVLLLWYEIDRNNPTLRKVCTGIKNTDCSAILTSKAAKIFSWLGWGEIGFFYFIGGLSTLLLAENSFNIVAWMNVFALPYTVYSILYQWRIAKQWCVFCLTVQVLLIAGGINVLQSDFSFGVPSIFYLIKAAMLYLFPVLAWFTLKPHILRMQEGKTLKREYVRMKANTEIFDMLLKKQKQITVAPDGLGIEIGNVRALHTIVKVCNPYCGACIRTHPRVEKLLEENKNVKLKIIFKTFNEETDPSVPVVKHLLAIAGENNIQKTQKALDDWYLAEEQDYEVFSNNYKMNGEVEQQRQQVQEMNKWCKDTGITFTPTFFVNGYQLPDAYNIDDLEYLLLE